jgi:hypothetical protein
MESEQRKMQLSKLHKLKNLNIELLETLIQTCSFIQEYTEIHGLPFPTEDRFLLLIQRARNLMQEINEEIALPPILQHRFKTPSEKTEPFLVKETLNEAHTLEL